MKKIIVICLMMGAFFSQEALGYTGKIWKIKKDKRILGYGKILSDTTYVVCIYRNGKYEMINTDRNLSVGDIRKQDVLREWYQRLKDDHEISWEDCVKKIIQ